VSSDAPNPFIFGSPDGSGRGRRGIGGGAGEAKGPVERVAKADFSVAKLVLIDLAITAYFGFIAWALFASSSESDAPSPAEAWFVLGFTVLMLLGLLIAFGHFVLQYLGLLGVLYARSAGGGWEFGPRWGFILRHRLRVGPQERVAIAVAELPPRERGGRNYGKFRWTLRGASDEVRFRSPVGLTTTVRDQIAAWAGAHSVSLAPETEPSA
jgi:hypothetical protein